MPVIISVIIIPDFLYLDFKNLLFKPNLFAADIAHNIYPLYTINNNLIIQGPNPDAHTVYAQYVTYIRRFVGYSGLDLTAANIAFFYSPFWNILFKDGSNENNIFSADFYISLKDSLSETRLFEAKDEAYNICHLGWELVGVTARTDDYSGWDIVPNVKPISPYNYPANIAIGFNNNLQTLTVNKVD